MKGDSATPSAQLPFQSTGIALWREIIAELKKLKFDRSPSTIAADERYLAMRSELKRLYSDAQLWHGTGRYKYGYQGEILDVLYAILRSGGLSPHADDWDPKYGPMRVTCTSLSRLYARLYAGMYCPNGERVRNELGSRELWAYYFFVSSSIVAIFEYRLPLRDVLRRDLSNFIPRIGEKVKRWSSKISSLEVSQKDAFLRGTDIIRNYPVLIGIKKGAFTPAQTSRFIKLHERRAPSLVSVHNFSHVEVPLDCLADTANLFKRFGMTSTPIIPIEFGEEFCRLFSFLELVSGRPLRAPHGALAHSLLH
jgi:hypothetical protein